MTKKILISIIFILYFTGNIYSQIENIIINDINAAYQLFGNEKYNSAYEYFTQMLKEYPKDPVYNYYAGACFLVIDNNSEKGIDYLRFASTRNVPSDVFFYLAKAYQMNYEFDKAIKYYNRFKYNASRLQIKKYKLENNITIAENGKFVTQNVFLHELNKIEKIQKNNIYRKYNSKLNDGKFVVYNNFVNSKNIDTNNISCIFTPSNIRQNEVFYFSMKNKKWGDKDIFSVVRLNDSTWSKPENVGSIINTPFDEDYPYLHSDGSTLYFASKGHYTIGGYDIFKSTWNWETNKWTEPVSLNFPINSTSNDFLYIPNNTNLKADFVSDRNCKSDSVNIYNIDISEETKNIKNLESLKEFADLFYSEKQNISINKEMQSSNDSKSIYDLNCGYDNTIEKSIKYQLKADSLRWVIDDYKKKLSKEIVESKRKQYNELIYKLEVNVARCQEIADSSYDKIRNLEKISFENHNNLEEEILSERNIKNTNLKKKKLELNSKNDLFKNSEIENLGLEIKKNFYTEQNPIPINIELPDGVVYIIQLGAFNNSVKPKIFKGLYPCIGFKKSNAKIIRYFAGNFNFYDEAVKAMPKVKECGFNDAFIIAYENNQRVTIATARENEKKYRENSKNEYLQSVNNVRDNKLYFELHVQVTIDNESNFENVKNTLLEGYEIKRIRKAGRNIIVIGKFKTYNKADAIKRKLDDRNLLNSEIHASFYN